MKSNAIARIIIWSIVIVLLAGLLLTTLFGFGRNHRSYTVVEESPLELEAVPVTQPAVSIPVATATVTDETNIRSAPTTDSAAVGVLQVGTTVEIGRKELIMGEEWGYILSPESGWILMAYVQEAGSTSTEVLNPGEAIGIGSDHVQEIEIEWAAGNIVIRPADVATIEITESGVSDPKYAMRWRVSGNKLSIDYCEEDLMEFGFGITINDNLQKDLTILVPRSHELASLEVDAASATLEVSNLMIREVEFDGASGACTFENCVVDQLDLDTASGDVTFSGTLQVLDCDAASANVYAVLDNVPSRVEMDSMSGNLDLTLPDNAGFTVNMDGMSSDFVSDFGFTTRNGSHVCGDGACRINVDAMSGDVYIRKALAAATIPETTAHHHTEECTTNPESCPDHSETHHTEPHA